MTTDPEPDESDKPKSTFIDLGIVVFLLVLAIVVIVRAVVKELLK